MSGCPGPAPPQTAHDNAPHPDCPECGQDAVIRVDVTDLESGDTDTVYLDDSPHDYVLTCGPGCELAHVQVHANGTHVLTVKPLADEGVA